MDDDAEDHRQEEKRAEEVSASQLLIDEQGEDQSESELNKGDEDRKPESTEGGFDGVTGRQALEEELVVVVQPYPVDRGATKSAGVGERVHGRRQ